MLVTTLGGAVAVAVAIVATIVGVKRLKKKNAENKVMSDQFF